MKYIAAVNPVTAAFVYGGWREDEAQIEAALTTVLEAAIAIASEAHALDVTAAEGIADADQRAAVIETCNQLFEAHRSAITEALTAQYAQKKALMYDVEPGLSKDQIRVVLNRAPTSDERYDPKNNTDAESPDYLIRSATANETAAAQLEKRDPRSTRALVKALEVEWLDVVKAVPPHKLAMWLSDPVTNVNDPEFRSMVAQIAPQLWPNAATRAQRLAAILG